MNTTSADSLQKVTLCIPTDGDSKCDETNNNPECNWDGGDCCAATCYENCQKKGLEKCWCPYTTFNCKMNTTVFCYKCIHGTCETNMNKCYSTKESVLQSLEACNINSYTNGNDYTVHITCGLDPYKNQTHLTSNPTYHYPGCGVFPSMCTTSPCCEVARRNGDTRENCDNTKTNRLIFDAVKMWFNLE